MTGVCTMRPINLTKNDPPKIDNSTDTSINHLYKNGCSGCYYTSECPYANKYEKCPFMSNISVSLDRATLQQLQINLVENALTNLQKYENLFERGMVDDMDRLDKMRRTVFDLLEKLKKDSKSEDGASILDRLGIKSHGQKSSNRANK